MDETTSPVSSGPSSRGLVEGDEDVRSSRGSGEGEGRSEEPNKNSAKESPLLEPTKSSSSSSSPRRQSQEFAHQFEKHSYGAPTNCQVCDGLLVGLWSQGLQCKMCGFNVHPGQGLGDHDDCRAEALFTPCAGLGDDDVRSSRGSGEGEGEGRSEEEMNENGAIESPLLEPKSTSSPRRQSQEFAHQFEKHSYGAPTNCQVCDGLLVGLWSQGLQCKMCGFNVHPGQGLGDHDDCRGEALFTPCAGLGPERVSAAEPHVSLGEALAQIHELRAANPNFVGDVGRQMNRDLAAQAQGVIVATGVEANRPSKLRRLKASVVPFVAYIDAVAAYGEAYVFVLLICVHALLSLVVKVINLMVFAIVLAPKHGLLTTTAVSATIAHDATVKIAVYSVLVVVAWLQYRLALIFQRKADLIDRFLIDVFQIDASEDFGISVAGAATRAREWSWRLLVSLSAACGVAWMVWYSMQPTSWEGAALPPIVGIAVPATVLVVCGSVLLAYSRSTR